MPTNSPPDASLPAVPEEPRWCLRCLACLTGMTKKGPKSPASQNANFKCEPTAQGSGGKCSHCKKSGGRTVCQTIPGSVWGLAQEVIAIRRKHIQDKEQHDQDPTPDDSQALKVKFKSVSEATEAYYKALEPERADERQGNETQTDIGHEHNADSDGNENQSTLATTRSLRAVSRNTDFERFFVIPQDADMSGEEEQPQERAFVSSDIGHAGQNQIQNASASGYPSVASAATPAALVHLPSEPIAAGLEQIARFRVAIDDAHRRLGQVHMKSRMRAAMAMPSRADNHPYNVPQLPGSTILRAGDDDVGQEIQAIESEITKLVAAQDAGYCQVGKTFAALMPAQGAGAPAEAAFTTGQVHGMLQNLGRVLQSLEKAGVQGGGDAQENVHIHGGQI